MSLVRPSKPQPYTLQPLHSWGCIAEGTKMPKRLAFRRSLTVALQQLERTGLISHRRSKIIILGSQGAGDQLQRHVFPITER